MNINHSRAFCLLTLFNEISKRYDGFRCIFPRNETKLFISNVWLKIILDGMRFLIISKVTFCCM